MEKYSLNLHPYWLDFIVLEDAMHATLVKKQSSASPIYELFMIQQ